MTLQFGRHHSPAGQDPGAKTPMRPRMLARRVSTLLGIAASLAGAGAVAATQEAGMKPAKPVYSADDEATYQRRFAALMASFKTGLGLESYDLLVPVAGVAAKPLPTARTTTISQSALLAARDYAAANNSAALLIYRRGKLEAEEYFGGTSAATPIIARSFAKPMTAVAIGRAIALGRIASLDTPVARYITEWRDDPLRSKMLVRHLLDMRTGFLPQAVASDPGDILNRAYLHPRHDDIIIHEYPMRHVPGERYDYANATAEMVALVIERATGMSYQAFLSREVITPLGAAGGTIWLDRPDGTAHSGCCLLLPAQTWMRLSILLLKDGVWGNRRLLPAGYVTEMRRGTPQNPHYGMGVWLAGDYVRERGFANPDLKQLGVLHSAPYAASDLYLFDGNANQVSYIVPSEDLIIMRMGVVPPRGTRWDNSFLPNLIVGGIVKARGTSRPQSAIPAASR